MAIKMMKKKFSIKIKYGCWLLVFYDRVLNIHLVYIKKVFFLFGQDISKYKRPHTIISGNCVIFFSFKFKKKIYSNKLNLIYCPNTCHFSH